MIAARPIAAGSIAMLVLLGVAAGQVPRGNTGGASADTAGAAAARVETAPLMLLEPDRFQLPLVLEPERRVSVMATEDGIVQAVSVRPGDQVRERQEVALLDRTEAQARLKIARAEVKEREALLKARRGEVEQAQLEAAQGRAELAQLAVDRCTLRAPFAGRVLAVKVSPGQYVPKGTTIVELADVSALTVLVPVDRNAIKVGADLPLIVEGITPITAKVQSLLPLPEPLAPLRALATPWTAAQVRIEQADRLGLEPGQRVRSPYVPESPIATVPARAVQEASGQPIVQVVRQEYVVNVPVVVLGTVGGERRQVSGAFRPADVAIVESSMPLAAGTYLHFPEGPPGAPPQRVAEVAAPGGPATRVAPIGSASRPTAPGRTAPAAQPAPKGSTAAKGSGAVSPPF